MLKLSIGKKLGLGFLVLILVVVVTNLVSIFGSTAIRDRWERSEAWEGLHSSLLQREIEHLHWANQLQNYLVRQSAQGFALELDPTQCNLGQWLNSGEFHWLGGAVSCFSRGSWNSSWSSTNSCIHLREQSRAGWNRKTCAGLNRCTKA